MARWHAEELVANLKRKGIQINSNRALILGFTFKENCPDIRNTKVIKIIDHLANFHIKCDIVDPLVNKKEILKEYKIDIQKNVNENRKYEIIIVALAHKYFVEFDLEKWKSFCADNCYILDLKGIVPRELNPKRP